MATKDLTYRLVGKDESASKSITGVASHAQSSTKMIASSFSKMGSLIGGEIGEVLGKLSDGFSDIGEAGGKKLSAKLAVGGMAIAGIGGLLTSMGSKEKQATDQLAVAVQNSGHDMDEFEGKIEHTVKGMEKYGYTAVQTKNALTTLTDATHDPAKAIGLMGEAANLAAVKHISLDDAARTLAKTIGGSTRLYKEFGITVKTNADGTKDLAGAQTQLAGVLHGQADAAANNFRGRLKELTATVEDSVASFGQHYGPAITAAGAAMTLVGPLAKGVGSAVGALGKVFRDSADTAIAADEEAAASTEKLAGTVQGSADAQLASFAQVDEGAQAASATAIGADEAAEASTTKLAGAVQASADVQLTAFAEVGKGAQATAATAVAADEEMMAGNAALAASSEEAAAAQGASKLAFLGSTTGILAFAGAAYIGGKALANYIDKGKSGVTVMEGFGKGIDNLTTALVNNTGPSSQVTEQWAKGQVQSSGLADKAAKAGITIDDLTTAITGNKDQFNALVERWKASGKPSGDTLTALLALKGEYLDATGKVSSLADKTYVYSSAVDTSTLAGINAASAQKKHLAPALDEATLKMMHQNDAAGLLAAGLQRIHDKTIDAYSADLSFKDAQQSVTDAIKTNGKTLDENTAAGRSNIEALLSARDAAEKHADAVAKSTGSAEKAEAAYQSDIVALRVQAKTLGINIDSVDGLSKSINTMPTFHKTDIDVRTDAARQKALDLKSIIDSLPSVKYLDIDLRLNKIAAGSSGHQDPSQFNASGTDDFSGGDTAVAEREPEIIAARGVSITPLSKLRGGGGSAPAINLQVHAPAIWSGDTLGLARLIMGLIEQGLNSGLNIRGITN